MNVPTLAAAREQGAQLLENVLQGDMSPMEALDQWPLPINSDARTLVVAWTSLSHYSDDLELLEADCEYARIVRQRLGDLARKLRTEVNQLGDKPSRGFLVELLFSLRDELRNVFCGEQRGK